MGGKDPGSSPPAEGKEDQSVKYRITVQLPKQERTPSEELLERCLQYFEMPMDVNLGSLSMGQKKKVYICVALAANTKYLLLDEPTNGLDILSKSLFRKVVVTGMSEDKTVIISTHQVHDVERLLDHVGIVDKNRVLLDQRLEETDEAPVDIEQLFIDTLTKK